MKHEIFVTNSSYQKKISTEKIIFPLKNIIYDKNKNFITNNFIIYDENKNLPSLIVPAKIFSDKKVFPTKKIIYDDIFSSLIILLATKIVCCH